MPLLKVIILFGLMTKVQKRPMENINDPMAGERSTPKKSGQLKFIGFNGNHSRIWFE